MNIDNVTFDNFKELSKEEQNEILNDYSLLALLVKKNVSEHRYLHSLSVANTCKQLAKLHNYDEYKAYLAGLLHDCCKFPNSDESKVLENYLKKYEPKKINGICGAYHSWVAPYYLKDKLGFNDREILNAIYNHTICVSKDTLSLILYVADKREPLREINDDVLEIAKKDLLEAYDILNVKVKDYLESVNEGFVENCL